MPRLIARRAVAGLALVAALSPASATPSRTRGSSDRLRVPRVMLWAWERAERLATIDPDAVGVAFLARTYRLAGDDIVTRPRLQPLDVPPGTALMAVARIETDRVRPPRFAPPRAEWLGRQIAAMAALPGVRAIQIDFDATVSERPFYRDVIRETRSALGRETPLSITALASWCMHDAWIADLDVDEIVPMLFRMGDGEDRFRPAGEQNAWRVAACRGAIGVSTDEPTTIEPGGRRVYIFHPTSWTSEAIAAVSAGRAPAAIARSRR